MKIISGASVSYVRYIPTRHELTVDEASFQRAREELDGHPATEAQIEERAHAIALNNWIRRGFERNAFAEVRLEAEPPVSTGWVRVDDPFATQWGEDEWLINASHQVDLLMRTDAVQVPAAMIREHVAVKLREAAEQGGPKKKQREVKDLVTMQLRRRSLPKMQLIEAIWDLSSNEVRVHTTSKAALERFEELFNESFDVSAQRLTPKTTLVHRGWSQELADGLNHCVAVDFHLGEQTAGREEVGS